jgi:hypothetical protein
VVDQEGQRWTRSEPSVRGTGDKSVPLTTVDPGEPLDDLAPFGQLVGAARVVALGESSHHVHEFYRLRHRLIRYLVERHGFTVLALEAPFTEAGILDDWVHGSAGSARQAASGGVAWGSVTPRSSTGLLVARMRRVAAGPDTVESTFPDDAAWFLADLRAAGAVIDAARHSRMRMPDYFLEQSALTGFDAIVYVTETRASEYVRGRVDDPSAV